MRKFFAFVLLIMVAAGAAAQSDCMAPHCGQIVIPGAEAGEWATALGVHVMGEGGEVYIRARYGPADGTPAPDPVFVTVAGGDWNAVVPDVVSYLWNDLEAPGTLILDFASYDPVNVYELAFNVNGGYWAPAGSSRLFSEILIPGCYYLPNLVGRSFVISVFNPSEEFHQTIRLDGDYDLAAASPIYSPSSITLEAEAGSEFCIGVEPPTLPPGVEPTLALLVAVEARGPSPGDRFPAEFLRNQIPP